MAHTGLSPKASTKTLTHFQPKASRKVTPMFSLNLQHTEIQRLLFFLSPKKHFGPALALLKASFLLLLKLAPLGWSHGS
jgi:hypothetical protein